jgi:DNA gyrase inhibitor GyrI
MQNMAATDQGSTDNLAVRIVQLPPMRVASVHAYGPEPEHAAWAKLEAWAGPAGRGYFADPAQHRIFGFNNPNPSPGSPNYGYEFWIMVGPDEQGGDVTLADFPGGLYAVARVDLITEPYDQIPAGWMALNRWLEVSRYRMGRHQWLEEHIAVPDAPAGQFSLDLYMPIAE